MSAILKKYIFIPVAILLALVLIRFKGVFVAATVNKEPISRIAVLAQLEKAGGKSVLDTLITNTLVLQEAKKEKVTASTVEISNQINQISDNLKAQGQDLKTALAAQGMTQNDLNDQVKLQILVQKMAGKNITVTDQEISDSFNQNKTTYPKGTTLDKVKDQIKQDLTNQKLNEAINTWITNLKSKAKVDYFVNY